MGFGTERTKCVGSIHLTSSHNPTSQARRALFKPQLLFRSVSISTQLNSIKPSTTLESKPTPLTAKHQRVGNTKTMSSAQDSNPMVQANPSMGQTYNQGGLSATGNQHVQGSNNLNNITTIQPQGYVAGDITSQTTRQPAADPRQSGTRQVRRCAYRQRGCHVHHSR